MWFQTLELLQSHFTIYYMFATCIKSFLSAMSKKNNEVVDTPGAINLYGGEHSRLRGRVT